MLGLPPLPSSAHVPKLTLGALTITYHSGFNECKLILNFKLWHTTSLSFTRQLHVFTWLFGEWKQVLHMFSLTQWLGYGVVRCLRWLTPLKIQTYSNFGSKYTASSVWKRLCLYLSPFPSVVLTQYISAPLKSFKLCTSMSKAFSCSSICKHYFKCRHRTYMQQQAVVLSWVHYLLAG